MLTISGFPLDNRCEHGMTALIIGAGNKQRNKICEELIVSGADINLIANGGVSALSEAIKSDNEILAEVLIKAKSQLFFSEPELVDRSPFYVAIRAQKKWALEVMCDHGTDINSIEMIGCIHPLLFAAYNGFDDICLYLSDSALEFKSQRCRYGGSKHLQATYR